jgi:hypothetical protein
MEVAFYTRNTFYKSNNKNFQGTLNETKMQTKRQHKKINGH